MKINDIKWNVDIDDIYEALDNMTAESAADILEVPYNQYINMSTDERHDYTYELIHSLGGIQYDIIAKIMGLPTEIDFDANAKEDLKETISDWLADEYGFSVD